MADTLYAQSVETFLDTLASAAPTPGGGSVAALNGAMAAGLLCMVCTITAKKLKDAHEASTLEDICQQAEALRQELQHLATEDIRIFERLSAAYKLPRTTEADAASRLVAIQQLTIEATDVPLRTARAAAHLLPLCATLVNRSSRMLVSDVGIAALLTRAATHSALLNVDINLAILEDKNYVRRVQAQMEDLTSGMDDEVNRLVTVVRNRIQP